MSVEPDRPGQWSHARCRARPEWEKLQAESESRRLEAC
jgi:hypothetical protein